jgi:hypothetical protein
MLCHAVLYCAVPCYLVPSAALGGPLPSSITNLTKLEVLSLESNELSGTLPANMCSDMTALRVRPQDTLRCYSRSGVTARHTQGAAQESWLKLSMCWVGCVAHQQAVDRWKALCWVRQHALLGKLSLVLFERS